MMKHTDSGARPQSSHPSSATFLASYLEQVPYLSCLDSPVYETETKWCAYLMESLHGLNQLIYLKG